MSISVSATNVLGNVQFQYYNSSTRTFEQVDEVVTDIAYQNLSIMKLNKILKAHAPRLVKLSDGTNKLYLHLRLLGGMMEPDNLSLIQKLGITDNQHTNEEIVDRIIQAVPADTYSDVAVTTLNHQFSCTDEAKLTRKITLSPRNWEYFVNMLNLLFLDREIINTNRAVKAILGSNEDQNVNHLVKAYKRNYKFEIMISMDEQYHDFTAIPDKTSQIFEGCLVM